MMGFQAEGAAPIVRKCDRGETRDDRHRHPHRQPGKLASRPSRHATRAAALSIWSATTEIVAAYKYLGRTAGVFCEPASAASVAGLVKLARTGFFREEKPRSPGRKIRIVCICTGHGLKDPDNARKFSEVPVSIPATADAVLEHVSLATALMGQSGGAAPPSGDRFCDETADVRYSTNMNRSVRGCRRGGTKLRGQANRGR